MSDFESKNAPYEDGRELVKEDGFGVNDAGNVACGAGGNGWGRPSTFNPDYVALAAEYFSRVHTDEASGSVKVPSRVFFARSIGEHLSTVKNWEKMYPEFGAVMEDGIEHAKELRIMLAENKKLDGAFSKFVLASAYGMTERSAVEVTGEGGGPFEVNIRVVDGADVSELGADPRGDASSENGGGGADGS